MRLLPADVSQDGSDFRGVSRQENPATSRFLAPITGAMELYRFECPTRAGFLQRAVVLAQSGYRYFVQGEVPERRAPSEVDERLLAKYGLRLSRRARAYRKEYGFENGHYFRFGRSWVLMATARSFFLDVDGNERVLDLRENPLRVFGYTVSLRRDGAASREGSERRRVSVRLDEVTYLELRAYFESLSCHRSEEALRAEFWRASNAWEPYAPVKRQFRAILWRVNERRREAGLSRVPLSCLRIHRRLPKHFAGHAERDPMRGNFDSVVGGGIDDSDHVNGAELPALPESRRRRAPL